MSSLGFLFALLLGSQAAWPEAMSPTGAARTEAENLELNQNMKCVAPAQRGNKLTEAEALAIAREALAAHEPATFSGASFKTKRDDCGWDVYVTRELPGPGDHRIIRINAQGRVLAYVRGL